KVKRHDPAPFVNSARGARTERRGVAGGGDGLLVAHQSPGLGVRSRGSEVSDFSAPPSTLHGQSFFRLIPSSSSISARSAANTSRCSGERFPCPCAQRTPQS